MTTENRLHDSPPPLATSVRGDATGRVASRPASVLGHGRYLFASRGQVPHTRRVIDAALAVVAAAGLLAASLLAAAESTGEATVVHAVDELLGWLDPFWNVVEALAWVLTIGIVLVTILARRGRLMRDLSLAVLLVVVGGGVLGRAVAGEWPDLLPSFLSGEPDSYPAIRISMIVAVVVVARPELTRPARRMSGWLVVLAGVGAIVAEDAPASSVLGGAALGLAAAAMVRLVLGSAAGFPDRDRVLAGLGDLGIEVVDLQLSPRQPPGVATYRGRTIDDRPVQVKVYGRDARDAQFMAKLWRALSYRDPGPELAFSRLQQVEHESLVTLLADRAGVPVPDVVAAGSGGSGDALLVTAQPPAPRLGELADGPDVHAVLPELWRSVGRLRSRRIAHGRLNADAVIVDDGEPMIVDFGAGRIASAEAVLDTDVAEFLVSTAVLVGRERALAEAMEVLGPESVAAAIPYLQPAALTPHLRDEVHDRGLDLAALRTAAATRTGTELPQIVHLRRVSARDLVFMLLMGVAAYLIISQLADVGFDTIWAEISSARWEWLLASLVVAQAIFFTQAVAAQGAIPVPIPYGPTVLLQAALKFVGLTVPTTAGRIALTLRYFQKLGVKPATALASSAIDGVAGSVIQIVLVLLLWSSVDFDLDLSTSSGSAFSGLFWIGIALLVCGVLAVVVGALVPKVRARFVPHLKAAAQSTGLVLRSPHQLTRLMAGNLGNELVNGLALVAAARAYGADVSVAEALIVAMGVTLFTSIVPVPGGIGVAEAGLTAGLAAVGVPQAEAFAAALTYRLATYYLPPIWGYPALRWLSNRGFL